MPTRLIGLPGEPLNGIESRTLRRVLNLERRHVVMLANAIEVYATPVTTSAVTSWERGTPGGYPEALTTAMEAIEDAVSTMAADMENTCGLDVLRGSQEHEVATIRRPLGAKRIFKLLDLGGHGLSLSDQALRVLDEGGGDFWQALCDAAVSRAVVSIGDHYVHAGTRIAMDREPD